MPFPYTFEFYFDPPELNMLILALQLNQTVLAVALLQQYLTLKVE